jgi:dipeptidyl-peptidase-4
MPGSPQAPAADLAVRLRRLWGTHLAPIIGCVMGLAALSPADAQKPDSSLLTLGRLFSSPDFQARTFGPAQWFSGSVYTTVEPRAGGSGTDIVRYDAATGVRTIFVPAARLVPPGDTAPMTIESYTVSPDAQHVLVFTNSRRVWRQRTRGDFWLVDLETWSLRKVGGPSAPPSTVMFAKFSPDGQRIAYVRAHNLYAEEVAEPRITQLTSDGSRTVINGTFDWVYEEELSLRDGFQWSPDGQQIAYWQLDATGVRDFDLIDDTDSLYSFVTPVQYPKAGQVNSASRVGVVSAGGGSTQWLAVPGDPRNNYIARMDWAGNSSAVVIEHLNRLQDTLDLMVGDARTGAVRTIDTERDSAWVDVVDDLRWLRGGSRFLWVSERDGWRHAYSIARDGSDVRLLTPGSFDLAEPESPLGAPFIQAVDEAGGWVYFTASPANATQLYLYRARLDGKGHPERVTPAGEFGFHRYRISPDAHWAFHTYSSFGVPPTTELIKLPSHAVVRILEDNAGLKVRVAALRQRPVEFFRAGIGDGVSLDGWLMRPVDFDSTRKYPVLFYVYGGPWAQTVLDSWGGGRYLWHLMLAQRGYIVASMDSRGTSAPKGRAWRKVIYGRVGVVESADQVAGARVVLQRPYADATRVGVWGWSNGGSMTLSLMFRSPEIYGTGMAVSPVTDWRLYDTIYTERFMGMPDANAAGYQAASLLPLAGRLTGNLLLMHGMGDDNVHFQNSEMLINALVAADKPFRMMAYPNRTHCICEGVNTTRHVYGLLTDYLAEKIPAGPAGSPAAR